MHLVASGLVILLLLAVPALLLLWLFRNRARSRIYFSSVVLLTASYLAAMGLCYASWAVVGAFWPTVLLIGFLAALLVRLGRGIPSAWVPGVWTAEFFLTGLNLLLAAVFAIALPFFLQARSYEGEPLELAFPLRGGTFFVMGGGANWSVNHHFFVPAQRYALDIGKLNALGLRAAGLMPTDLTRYAVFGSEVVAPCEGEVIASRNDLPDRPPRDPDPDNRLGNHVVLFCKGHSVVLAHFQSGSVQVTLGDTVTRGQRLGSVGSSGMSFEPHLHIHAVPGRHTKDAALNEHEVGVAITFANRFLIRNEWFSN